MTDTLPKNLYHYTDKLGLEGILENQTLWATNYQFLNDASELVHFKEQFKEILIPPIKEFYKGIDKILLKKY